MLCCCCVKFYLNMCVNTPTILDDSHSEEFWFSSRTCLCQLKWQYMCVCLELSDVQLFVTPWTIACQAPLFMVFFRQEQWIGLPVLPPEDWTHISCLAGRFFTCLIIHSSRICFCQLRRQYMKQMAWSAICAHTSMFRSPQDTRDGLPWNLGTDWWWWKEHLQMQLQC